ncbi:MAG: CYTH domain-containing protein [Elusimicrobiales bacterium]|nr:CYTH domain-containing protein [Elusimicrobiales bacterium]
MELEYKWILPADETGGYMFSEDIMETPFMSGLVEGEGFLDMDSRYFDTESQDLKNTFHAALRIRKENGKSVLCLKMPKQSDGAFAAREEYETEADDIQKGLAKLPDCGAPADLCRRIAALPLKQIARVFFAREIFLIGIKKPEKGEPPAGKKGFCLAELSFDKGIAERHLDPFYVSPIGEIELEFKGGDEEDFHKWAKKFEKHFKLKPLKMSKLAQALRYKK